MELNRGHRSAYGSFILDRGETILGFDEEIEALTGWPAATVVGRHKSLDAPELGRPKDGTTPLYQGKLTVDEGSRGIKLVLNCRDGRRLETDARTTRLGGPGDQMLVTILRVVSLSGEAELDQELVRHDPLTSLRDRDGFNAQLALDFQAASTSSRPLALILADVDHLADINRRFGREAGDEALERLASILRVSVGDESRLFRLGDDDFAVLMPDAGRGDARQLAATLRSTTERYDFFGNGSGGPDVRLTLSLGAASFPADAENETDLLARAQDALSEARAMGRNRVWCYLRRPRVPLQVPVFFDGSETLLVGYTRDVSPSGLFVQTSEPMNIGMRCALAFPIPGGSGDGNRVRALRHDDRPPRDRRLPARSRGQLAASGERDPQRPLTLGV
jgi:diguanylate cyclase (GGDEF)-like protein